MTRAWKDHLMAAVAFGKEGRQPLGAGKRQIIEFSVTVSKMDHSPPEFLDFSLMRLKLDF